MPKVKVFTLICMGLLFACSQHYEEGTHPPKPPPKSSAGQPQVVENIVSGTIQLAEGLEDQIGENAVLFIIARSAPAGGPPLAVKRLDIPSFPFAYTISKTDAMMGQGFDWNEIDALYLVATIDADGSIGGVKTGDMDGVYSKNPVQPGASGVDIVIDTVH
ncbi:MAG: hypothetical protein QGG64_00015 [Candidatus Latescibacteria bacterium]|jgi:hypothetical protein|nr:hypothetical protein [Candidatus Latescibacterota bacterium]